MAASHPGLLEHGIQQAVDGEPVFFRERYLEVRLCYSIGKVRIASFMGEGLVGR